MDNSKKIMNLIGFLIIIVALYFGYRYWNAPAAETDQAPDNGGLSVQMAGSEAPAADNGRHIQSGSISEGFLAQLNMLSNVSFASSIFSDPVFRDQLKDFDKPIPEKAVGRVNPFAPVSAAERAAKPATTRIADPVSTATTTPVADQ